MQFSHPCVEIIKLLTLFIRLDLPPLLSPFGELTAKSDNNNTKPPAQYSVLVVVPLINSYAGAKRDKILSSDISTLLAAVVSVCFEWRTQGPSTYLLAVLELRPNLLHYIRVLAERRTWVKHIIVVVFVSLLCCSVVHFGIFCCCVLLCVSASHRRNPAGNKIRDAVQHALSGINIVFTYRIYSKASIQLYHFSIIS